MGLWLLANTAREDAAELRLTNSSNVKITGSETVGLENVQGGPRYLRFEKTSSSERRITYLNGTTAMRPATFCVVTSFSEALGSSVSVKFSNNVGGVEPVYTNASFDEMLCGYLKDDWCLPIDPGNTYSHSFALCLSGAAVTVGQVYFCHGLEMSYRQGSLQFQPVPVTAQAVYHAGNFFKLLGQASFGVTGLTQDEVDSYFDLPKDEPVFFYDDTGSGFYGNFLPHRLWHCIIANEEVTAHYNGLFSIQFSVGILKVGNG